MGGRAVRHPTQLRRAGQPASAVVVVAGATVRRGRNACTTGPMPRATTTVPTQALTLLNNEFVLLQARHLAERVMRESAPNEPAAWTKTLYWIALSREPSPRELAGHVEFLRKQREFQSAKATEPDLAALTDLAHVMLNATEFVYIN